MHLFNYLAKSFFAVVVVPALWLSSAGSALAVGTNVVETYDFTQTGWAGGGSLTGNFTVTFPAGSTQIDLNNTYPILAAARLDGNPNGADFGFLAGGFGEDHDGGVVTFQLKLDANYDVVADAGNILEIELGNFGIFRPLSGTSFDVSGHATPHFPYYPNNVDYIGTSSDGHVYDLAQPLITYSSTLSGLVFTREVPEPGTLALGGLAGSCLLALRRKKA